MSSQPTLEDIARQILEKLDAYDRGALDESVDEPDPAARLAVVMAALESSGIKN